MTFAALAERPALRRRPARTPAPRCAPTARPASRPARCSRSADDVGADRGRGARRPAGLRRATWRAIVDGPAETTDAVFYAVGSAAGAPPTRAARLASIPAVTIALAKRPGRQRHRPRRARCAEGRGPAAAPAAGRRPRRGHPRLRPDRGREVERAGRSTCCSPPSRSRCSSPSPWAGAAALVVAIAVPVTLALTLFIYFLAGYTLNRVTLFALIFSIGILVDDAIVVVENIERHHPRERPGPAALAGRRRGGRRGRQPHHPRHLHGDRRDPADGLRARPDGPLHAADPDRRLGGDAVLAGRGVHRLALGGVPHLPPATAVTARSPEKAGRREGWSTRALPPVDDRADRRGRSSAGRFFAGIVAVLLGVDGRWSTAAWSRSRCCRSTTRASSRC